MGIVFSILAIALMIFVHELGHYTAGRILGFKIEQFALGFGPKLFGFTSKKTGIRYCLRVLPLGGYVQFNGETGESAAKGAFNTMAKWKRAIVLAAGSLMNILSAFLLAVLMLACIGAPTSSPVIETVETHEGITAASDAGMLPGDKVLSVNGREVSPENIDIVIETIRNSDGDPIEFIIERDGAQQALAVTPEYSDKDGLYRIGIQFGLENQRRGFLRSISEGAELCVQYGGLVYSSLGMLITGQVPITEMSGIVGTVSYMSTAAKSGLIDFLLLAIFVDINLGVFNLLPFLLLDGWKIVLLAYEGIFRRKVNPKFDQYASLVGAAILGLLFVFLTANDVMRIF